MRSVERRDALVPAVTLEELEKHRPHRGPPEVPCVVSVRQDEVLGGGTVVSEPRLRHVDRDRPECRRYAREVHALAVGPDQRARLHVRREPRLRRVARVPHEAEIHRRPVERHQRDGRGDGSAREPTAAVPDRRAADAAEDRDDEHHRQHEAREHVEDRPDEGEQIGRHRRDQERGAAASSARQRDPADDGEREHRRGRGPQHQPGDVRCEPRGARERRRVHLIRPRAVVGDVVEMREPPLKIDHDVRRDEIRQDRRPRARDQSRVTESETSARPRVQHQ